MSIQTRRIVACALGGAALCAIPGVILALELSVYVRQCWRMSGTVAIPVEAYEAGFSGCVSLPVLPFGLPLGLIGGALTGCAAAPLLTSRRSTPNRAAALLILIAAVLAVLAWWRFSQEAFEMETLLIAPLAIATLLAGALLASLAAGLLRGSARARWTTFVLFLWIGFITVPGFAMATQWGGGLDLLFIGALALISVSTLVLLLIPDNRMTAIVS
ncbi:hypothetical protein GCM10009555_069470 [Acrocarpospora macrocephala]|uniref:Uncharacterized protein n=1 Tax=Acrocarpospora macrocephala TaxID=150177 RepID=A0A5M3X637_9ACTN|nr:hypothetical protein [Acrocarpospora macrocephala]GES16126.1 hypothetical protein Amac_097240 [Acrocarpospora macrocephala]